MASWYVDLGESGFEVIQADSIHRDDANNNLVLLREGQVVAVFVYWVYVMKVVYNEESGIYDHA